MLEKPQRTKQAVLLANEFSLTKPCAMLRKLNGLAVFLGSADHCFHNLLSQLHMPWTQAWLKRGETAVCAQHQYFIVVSLIPASRYHERPLLTGYDLYRFNINIRAAAPCQRRCLILHQVLLGTILLNLLALVSGAAHRKSSMPHPLYFNAVRSPGLLKTWVADALQISDHFSQHRRSCQSSSSWATRTSRSSIRPSQSRD